QARCRSTSRDRSHAPFFCLSPRRFPSVKSACFVLKTECGEDKAICKCFDFKAGLASFFCRMVQNEKRPAKAGRFEIGKVEKSGDGLAEGDRRIRHAVRKA